MADINDTDAQQPLQSERLHRRQVFWQITLPVIGGVLGLVLLLAAVLVPPLLPDPAQVRTLSNLMVILFLLLPNFLCMFALYLLLAYLVFGLNTFNRASARQLRRLHRLSETITDKTASVTDTVNRRTADMRVRLAGVENAMENAFTPPNPSTKLTDEAEDRDSS